MDRLNPAERLYNAYRFSDYGWPELDRIIKTLFDHKSDGFFVEAGALDGEYLSNTLYLEREKGWKGLLVEPDEEMFRLLRKKNRKIWSIHSCLATKPYPMKVQYFDCYYYNYCHDRFNDLYYYYHQCNH